MADSNSTQALTLASFPRVHHFNRGTIAFGHTIMHMQQTGFHTWGFNIYRCVYGDDPAWDRFLVHMKQAVSEKLARRGQRELLEQYLDWTVITDTDLNSADTHAIQLRQADKNEVRRRFFEWSQSRDDAEAGTENSALGHLPRFSFCVMIDDTCLETFRRWEDWVEAGRQGLEPPVVMIVLDAHCEQEGMGVTGFPAVEGCTREYTGWMYADVGTLPGVYDKLHHQGLGEGWKEYARPPLVYPHHQHGETVL